MSSLTLHTEIKSILTIQTRTKPISMLTLKPGDWRPASKNRVNFDHHPRKSRVNRSSPSKQVNFGPHTVNFPPPHKRQVTFDPNIKSKSNSIPHTKIKLISMSPLKLWCLRTKTKLISIHTLKPSIFRPSHKKQVISGPYTEVKSISIPTIKWSQFWCRDTKTK